MVHIYGRKAFSFFFLVLLIASVVMAAYGRSDAYTIETHGRLDGYKNGTIVIDLDNNRGKESFTVNTGTKVINLGTPMQVNRIPRHSVVRVTSEMGVALKIVVEEVPK